MLAPGAGRSYPMGRIAAVFKAEGSFVLVPGGVTHDFENRSAAPAGVLNLSSPGPFEPHMPSIAEWFTNNPPQDAVV